MPPPPRSKFAGPALFSVLSIIRQSVDNFRLEQRSNEILIELGKFQDEWVKFSEHLDKTDKQLLTFTKSFAALASTRRNQLNRSLNRIDDLEAVQTDIDLRPAVATEEPVVALEPAPLFDATVHANSDTTVEEGFADGYDDGFRGDGFHDDSFHDENGGPHLREVAG